MAPRINIEAQDVHDEATKIRDLADDFDSLIQTEKDNVLALPWEGDAREAFVEKFEEAKTDFETHVSPHFRDIAQAMDDAADLLEETDSNIGASINF